MLKSIVARKETIVVGDDSFEVKGLTIEGVANLLKVNASIVNDLFNGNLSLDGVLKSAPAFAAVIIATAAGEPDAVENAAQLPAGTQIEALEAIWNMTLPNEEVLKKLMARLQNLGLANQK